jgi:arylsulfatase A-like enzyme
MNPSITRRRFLETSVGAASALSFACNTPAPAESRPNIVLLMGDDHGWDEVAYNGHPDLKTPVLDEMAAAGLRLDNFYSAHPTCSPTRGSALTGRHPNRYGTFVPNCSIRPEEITIAHLLSDAGYACGHFGKWHVGPVKAESPTNPGAMGFDEWVSHDNFFEMNPVLSRNGAAPEQFTGEGSDVVVEETIRFIDTAKQDQQPFLAVVWFGSPHEPYSGLAEDLALYDDVPEKYADRKVTLTSMETGLPVERPLGEVLRERYAEITAMDRAIGRLRQHLETAGLRDNTIFWYCGDNGIPVSGRATTPFRGLKAQVYEGGVRVPGVIEWPQRIAQPRVSDVNTVTSDMLPTICDVVGLPLPQRPLDGVSLKGLIDGAMTERPSPICFWSYGNSQADGAAEPYIDPKLQEGTTPLVKLMDGVATRSFQNFHHRNITGQDFSGPRAILDNRYKLVVDGGPGNEAAVELFDIRGDRAESENLAAAQPNIAESLQQQLRDWQQSVLESLTGADYS